MDIMMTVMWKMGIESSGEDLAVAYKKEWVRNVAPIINGVAEKYGIPSYLLAGVAYNEVGGDPTGQDAFTRGLFTLFDEERADKVSFGYVSMQVRVAASTLDYDPESVSTFQRAAIVESLLDPTQNLMLAAKHISDTRDSIYGSASGVSESRAQRLAAAYNGGDQYWDTTGAQHYGDLVVEGRDMLEGLLGNAYP